MLGTLCPLIWPKVYSFVIVTLTLLGYVLLYFLALLFSNGMLDPWSAGGVTKNITDSLVAVLIEDGAHHLDLRHKNTLDPPSVVQARNTEKFYIAKWIKEYNEKKKKKAHFRISSKTAKRKFKNIAVV